MSTRRCVSSLLCLAALTTACGRDPTDEDGPPESTTGALELTISTTGQDLDPDGYTVMVDASGPVAAPVNGTVTIPDLEAGVHTLTLTGLASNCTLVTSAPLEVIVPGPAGARVSVAIGCTAVYTLAYHGASGVELTDAAGTVHRTLVPEARPLAWSPDGRMLAVSKGKGLWLANLDDGGLRPFITDTSIGDFSGGPYAGFHAGAWSPDGRELLLEHPQPFFSNSYPQYLSRFPLDSSDSPDVIFVAPAGTGCAGLGSGLRGHTWPGWAPGGDQIVANACSQVYVLSPDGSGTRVLADGRQPEWSPDGSAIVYVAGPYPTPTNTRRIAVASLHLVNPDGGNDRPLTAPAASETDQDPAWSPDGSTIAFVRLGLASDSTLASVHAYLVGRDGTGLRQLTVWSGTSSNWAVDDPWEAIPLAHPAWSPDGLRLVYSGRGGTYVINADGSGLRLVSEAQASVPALWRP